MANLPTSISLPLTDKILSELIPKAEDWAIMHGAGMRSKKNFDSDSLNFAPFILTPSSFPRKEFEKALKIQITLNKLIHEISNDIEFLRNTLSETIKVDEFTRNLFVIYEKVLKHGIVQPITLGLLRSDLMLETKCSNMTKPANKPYCCWMQVEINTIASGFGHLGPISKEIQSFVLEELGEYDKLQNLPPNNALENLCNGMIKAWEIMENSNGVILFVIENISYNICDQRFHEFKIRKLNPKIKIIRKTLTEIYEQSSHGPRKELIVDSNVVNVVYFRSGYEPSQYPSQKEWDARLLIELSNAIKCPSINLHLAGTKKVQQALSSVDILRKYIKNEETLNLIKGIFTGLYPLDNDDKGNAAFKMALENPDKYVLKPQREGGGNNVYGNEIPNKLKQMSIEERSAWILMDRINPPTIQGYMIRPGNKELPKLVDLISELGIFGVILGDNNNIFYNYTAGHMLRTKLSTADEGGVAAGLGALDSVYLID